MHVRWQRNPVNAQPCPQSEDLDLKDPEGMNMAGIKV